MQNWQKNRNFRKHRNTDGSVIFVITVNGEKIEVSEAVYSAYAEGGYKMEHMEHSVKNSRILQDSNGIAVRDEHGNALLLPEREVSLEKLLDENWDFLSSEPSPEDEVMERIQIEALHEYLEILDANERALINALFFDGMTEREYSAKTGIPQKTINDRKFKVLGKLKKLLQKN